MGLSKLAIISIATGSVIGIGAITAVGVVVSQNQNSTNKNSESVAWTTLNPATTIQQKLESFLKTIQVTDLVLTKKQNSQIQDAHATKKSLVQENIQTLKVSDVYAFNASEYEFSLDANKPIPANTSLTINIKQDSLKELDSLNQGKLVLEIKVIDEKTKSEKTKELVIETFKQPDEKIKTLINTEKEKDTLSILSKDENGVQKFTTLEYLNRTDLNESIQTDRSSTSKTINGLSALLNEVIKENKSPELDKDITLAIKGQVKLERIAKDEKRNVNFYLTSADDSFLKLTRKEKEVTSEILVKQIKINNLAISSISVVPIGNDIQKSEAYTKELLAKWKDGKTEASELSVEINKAESNPRMASMSINLPISAYKLEKDEKPSSNIEASLLVNYGSGSYIKTYDTSKNDQLKELIDAGISFGIFSKDISKRPNPSMPEVHSGIVSDKENKLETYFTQTSNKNPVAKKEVKSDQKTKQDGDFFLNVLDNKTNAGKFALGVNMPASASAAETRVALEQETMNQNWLIFVNYSYPNMNKEKETTSNVLYAPSLSLIHVDIAKKST